MSRLIFCHKLKKQALGLPYPPYPSDLGKRIFETISQEAWQQWLDHQALLINHQQLKLTDPEARAYLKKEMEVFLFA